MKKLIYVRKLKEYWKNQQTDLIDSIRRKEGVTKIYSSSINQDYDIIYHVEPEGVTLHFEGINPNYFYSDIINKSMLRIYAWGLEKSIKKAEKRILLTKKDN